MTGVSWGRLAALMRKEAAELRAAPGVLLAPLFMLLTAVAIPVFTTIVLPGAFDAPLDEAEDLVEIARRFGAADVSRLSDAAAVQVLLLHQFLPLLALVPVAGAMTLVTTSVVGEKQARTLEPLLATPLTSFELLAAKTLTALIVALAFGALGFVLLVGAAALAAERGVAAMLLSTRALALLAGVAPAASLVALTLGAIVSTRAKDARSAQQAGVVVVVPLVAAFIAGLNGALVLTTTRLLWAAAALLVVAAALAVVGVGRFDRERVLTDWT